MADEAPHTVQHDDPPTGHAETREETIARVVDEQEAAGARYGGSADPSARRGVNRALGRTHLVWGVIGAVIGAALGVILGLVPGPFETDGAGSVVGYAVLLAVACGIVAAVLASLVVLAREDGRIEREVERSTGTGPVAPGRPQDPKHDLKQR
jgi:hypothetical protein